MEHATMDTSNDAETELPVRKQLEAYQIRAAGASDTAAVRELTRAAYTKWIAAIGREPTPMTVDYEPRVRDHRIDLLHVDGRLAALIELVPEDGHLLIDNVAVLPGGVTVYMSKQLNPASPRKGQPA